MSKEEKQTEIKFEAPAGVKKKVKAEEADTDDEIEETEETEDTVKPKKSKKDKKKLKSKKVKAEATETETVEKKPKKKGKKKSKKKAAKAEKKPKKAKAKKEKTERQPRNKVPTEKLRAAFKKKKEWTIRELSEHIDPKSKDRVKSDSSVRNHIRNLIADKTVKQSGRGTYTRRK